MARFWLVLALTAVGFPQSRPAVTPEITTSSLPANLPVERIGANDLLSVAVYDSPEFSRTLRVDPDGSIRLPMLRERIRAGGLFPAELESAIAKALQKEGLIVDPVVTVTIIEYHSRPISVAGAVRRPVTFQAAGPVTLLEALARAEGLSAEAGPEILVTRPAAPGAAGQAPPALVQRIPVKGLIDAADPELNLRLAGGEEIRVPEVGRVFVVGNVRKPGAYRLDDQTETSVFQVLALSEGLAPFAGKQAYIYRREGGAGSKHEIPIELRRILERKAPDVPLQANDILYVPDNSNRRIAIHALERMVLFGSTAGATALIFR
jgi:polysaccharide export outer membrane protein